MELVTSQRFLCFLLLPILVVTNLDHQASALSILSTNHFHTGVHVNVTCSPDAIDADPDATEAFYFLELSRKTYATKKLVSLVKLNNTNVKINIPNDRVWMVEAPEPKDLEDRKFERSVMKVHLMIKDTGRYDAGDYFCGVFYKKDDRNVHRGEKEMLECDSEVSILSSHEFEESPNVTVTCSADAIGLDSSFTAGIRALRLSRKTYASNYTEHSIVFIDNVEAIIGEDYMWTNISDSREWKLEMPTLGDLTNNRFSRTTMKVVLTIKDLNRDDSGQYICMIRLKKNLESLYFRDHEVWAYDDSVLITTTTSTSTTTTSPLTTSRPKRKGESSTNTNTNTNTNTDSIDKKSTAIKAVPQSTWMIFGAAAIPFMIK